MKLTTYLKPYLLLLCLVLAVPAVAQQQNSAVGGIAFSPVIYRVSVPPGHKANLEFHTKNLIAFRATAHMEIVSFVPQDWTYRPRYNVSHERDAASWFPKR